jgi:hypothetical protein
MLYSSIDKLTLHETAIGKRYIRFGLNEKQTCSIKSSPSKSMQNE